MPGRGRPFKKGAPGRPKGALNKATLIEAEIEAACRRKIPPDAWDALFAAADEQAKKGRPQLLLGLLDYAAKAKPRDLDVKGSITTKEFTLGNKT